jgi:flavin-binding protein dodecin
MILKAIFALLIVVPSFVWTATVSAASDIKIEWSMPDRLLENTGYPGYDASSPVPKYDPSVQMLPVGGWLVNFDVCSGPAINNVQFDWFVDGKLVATTENCFFSYRFKAEDVYDITVELTDAEGGVVTASQQITVQDWLIIALGDAYGSGEGNPIEPVTVKGLKDYSVFAGLASELEDNIQQSSDELTALEAGQSDRQKSLDDARIKRDEEEQSLNNLKQQQSEIEGVIISVAKDSSVVAANKNVANAQLLVNGWQDQVNKDQKEYNNCKNFIHCAIALNRLNNSKQSLKKAKSDLTAEKNKLKSARDEAVVKYSTDKSIRSYSQLTQRRDSLTASVKNAQKAYDSAKKSLQAAEESLQRANESMENLRVSIVEMQDSSKEAVLNAKQTFLDNLPVWTRTAPSWGSPEPSYADIILNGRQPGEALRCHRSMNSGQARAALKLEQADPHTSVTFLHLSCAGAAINNLTGTFQGQDIETLLSSLTGDPSNFNYTGLPGMKLIPAQIAAAAQKAKGREVDAIIISVGANDIKLDDIITECVLGEPCHENQSTVPTQEQRDALMASVETNCRPTSLFNEVTGESLLSASFPFTDNCMSDYNAQDTTVASGDALRTFNVNAYIATDPQGAIINASLADKLRGIQSDSDGSKATLDKHFPLLEKQRVYITQYPDFTSDDVGNYCGWIPGSSGNDDLKNLPGVTQSETTWMDLTVTNTLREEIKNAALLQQWNYVADTGNGNTIASVSKQHGYCADNNWAIRLSESLLTQQDSLGVMLPNVAGHELYQQAITAQLMQDLYPDGLQMPPRKPDVKQVVVFSEIDDAVAVNIASGGRVSPLYLLLILLTAGLFRIVYSRNKCVSGIGL